MNGDDVGLDRFYLAITLWNLGDHEQALERYQDTARRLAEADQIDDHTRMHLARIQAETAELLGLDAKTPEPPGEVLTHSH